MLGIILPKGSPFRRGGGVTAGEVQDTQAPNEIPRSWASHSLAFFRLTRSKKGSTPRRLFPYHPILPISRRSAQDDLLKWGAVVRVVEAPTPTGVFDICCFDRRAVACCRRLLKYHYVLSGRSKNTPTGLIDVLLFVCRGGYHPPVLPNAMSKESLLLRRNLVASDAACGG